MDSSFKESYEKHKNKVKMWEKSFKKLHNRIPSKHDIREASNEIRYSYKKYYELKTSLLENTLNDVLSEDGFDICDFSQGESVCTMNSSADLPEGVASLVNNDDNTNANLFSNFTKVNEAQNHIISNDEKTHDNSIIKQFESIEDLKINKNAWNQRVTCKSDVKRSNSPKDQHIRTSLNAKLFSSTSFKKRNPLKDVSRLAKSKSIGTSDSFFSGNTSKIDEDLPDLETILTQKLQQKSQDDLIAKVPKIPQQTTIEVDKKWLSRCIGDTSNILDSSEKNPNLNDEQIKKYGLSNLNTTNINIENAKLQTVGSISTIEDYNDSDSVVSNSDDESTQPTFRHAVKRRRILLDIDTNQKSQNEEKTETVKIKNVNPKQEDNRSLDNTADVQLSPAKVNKKRAIKKDVKTRRKKTIPKEIPNRKSKREKKNVSYCENDDQKKIEFYELQNANELSLSDNHGTSENKNKLEGRKDRSSKLSINSTGITRKRGSRGKKNQSPLKNTNEQCDDADDEEYIINVDEGNLNVLPRINVEDIMKAENVVKKYVNAAKSISSRKNTTTLKQIDNKTKLEAKVAAGKLNENFLRLNMKKKVFVRGKKNFNYGKYKKTLWKRKKEASALCGPEMDMKGCDGGILTCFKCGQPGHFAQQCKIKGDNLLPMEANLDEGIHFPSLEEAEEMASQEALKVHAKHGGNISIVANKLLYKDVELSEEKGQEALKMENEALKIESSEETTKNIENLNTQKLYIGHKIPEDFLKKSGLLENAKEDNKVEPLYNLKSDGSVSDVTEEVIEVLRMFGHQHFRKNQDKAIMRILSGLSTLVTLSTGSGKSLCYQLPAYLYSRKRKAITLVISPLVSLMEDQVHGVPTFIRAHCLHTNQTPQQRLKVLELISKGEVDVLLVSPEAVVAGERSTGFGAILKNLPPIAFACIDEAHCVSQWSHNFRPSYLMICKVLQQKLGVQTILGLTATATQSTQSSIIRHLRIPDGLSGVISDTPLPNNLILSVSKDYNRDAALIKLLRSERFDCCQSIIIYCTRREECERVAGFIRTCLQDKKPDESNVKKRKRVNWNAEPYHAGMAASRRRTVQNAFMGNQLRIVVATVAFGMGINKPDIRAIIHYNMPRNFESYVQEVGRAGRDGKISHCHLFLDRHGSDQSELRRHIYANSIDRHVIRKLLQKVFIRCACEKNFTNEKFIQEHSEEIKASQDIDWDTNFDEDSSSQIKRKRICPGHEIGFSTDSAVQALDIPGENISTLLCYLELENRWGIHLLSNAYTRAKVISYGGPHYLKKAAQSCPPLAMAIALELKNGTFNEQSNIIEFSVIDIASAIGWNSGVVKFQLKNLEWETVNGFPKRSSISVNFYDLGFRVRSPGDFTDEELDEALDSLYQRAVQQENTQLIQLQYIFEGISSVAYDACTLCCDKTFSPERSDQLKEIIRTYFKNDYQKDIKIKEVIDPIPDEQIISDVHAMINMYPENNFTGRALARIFHGIPSPNFPAVIWGRCKYWRAYIKSDFNRLVRLSNLAIVKMRT